MAYRLASGSLRCVASRVPPFNPARTRWFESEVRPHEPLLRAWLHRRFPARVEVDDIVQEAYLRLWSRPRELDLRAPKAFLFVVARNLALDFLRRRRARGEMALPDDPSAVAAEQADVPDEDQRSIELRLLEEAIEALPSRCREIFRLRKVNGLPQELIAARLGISEHTVSAQLTIGFHKCATYVLARASRSKGTP